MPVEQRHRADPVTVRRAMVFGLLIAAMLVVITPTLRDYLQHRSQISQLRKEGVADAAEVQRLDAVKKQWLDPNFIKDQAGQKLGYAMPGKSVTVYIDDSNKTHAVNPTTGVANATSLANRPWYGQMWESVVQSNNSK